jgi:hypothetical protein
MDDVIRRRFVCRQLRGPLKLLKWMDERDDLLVWRPF